MATAVSSTVHSPRNKKAGGPPPTAMPQPQNKRPSLRYSLNHISKALADVVGKEKSAHVRSASAIPTVHHSTDRSITPSAPRPPLQSRRPSIAGAFDPDTSSAPASRAPSQAAHVRTRTISVTNRALPQPKAASASPQPKPGPPTTAPCAGILPRRRSLMIKGALAAPTAAPAASPVPVGTTKISIRPKAPAPRATPPGDERPVEVKERRTDSPRGTHAAVGRAKEREDSRTPPIRSVSGLPAPTAKGRASLARNDQTPKDDREKRRERREREKQAAEQKEREKKEALERARQAEAKKAEEAAAAQRAASGHRTSSSTTTLTSASSIFTSVSRSNTADSHSSGGSTKLPPPSHTTVFPRAAQTVVLTPPDDEEEEEDVTIQTPMTRSRTATGSTNYGDVSSPAISKTLLASISAQTESPIMAPLDQRLRRAGSATSLNSSLPSLPSPVHPSTIAFPPPAAGLKSAKGGDDDWEEEGDVSALLETVISPLKGQATPAMPRFASKSSARSRMPDTPSRGLPSREALSYASPAIPASVQRTKGDKAAKSNQSQHRGPRESILSWDAIVERSGLDEGGLEDMLRAPPPAVGLVSPDMRPARNLPRLTNIGPKRMNLAGMSDSEAEIEEEAEDQTIHGSVNGASQSISQVLFSTPAPASPSREKKRRSIAEKEQLWAAKEDAWQKQKAEWEAERAQWEAERAQWAAQQNQWNAQRAQWNAQQAEWSGRKTQWESERAAWTTREHELAMAVQARNDDLEALEQETSAHTAELEKRAEEHRLELEALMRRAETYERQSGDLRAAKQREVKFEAQARCTSALNSWNGVCAALKADADACAADRAALKVVLLGLEAMMRA